MKKVLQINSVILIMSLVFTIFISSATPVKADPTIAWFATFAAGLFVNNGRTGQTDRHEVNFNPSDNNYDPDGNYVGSTKDFNEVISAIGKGGHFEVCPGQSTRAKVKLFYLTCDEVEFPDYAIVCEDLLKNKKYVKELSKLINLDSKNIIIVPENNNKWLISVDTKNLKQKLHNIRCGVGFEEEVPGGLFNSGRKNVLRNEETRIRKLVIDPKEIALGVNSTKIQHFLKFCDGFIGGPPQLKPLEYVVNPKVEANAQMPLQADGTFAKAAVTIPKVETSYDSKIDQKITMMRTVSESPNTNSHEKREDRHFGNEFNEKPVFRFTPKPRVTETPPIKEEVKPQEGEIYVFFRNAKNQPCDGHFFLKETDSKTSKINDYEIKLQGKTQYITDLSCNNQSQISTEPGVVYGTCPVGAMVQIRLFESENWSNCYAINEKYPIKITIRGGK